MKWAVGAKAPGMVHARNVRPPVAGAKLISIDESSVRGLPGFIKVVSKGNYVAVVCEREEQAIRAARQLKVNWQKPATAPFPSSEDLYKYIRSATPDVGLRAERGRRTRMRRWQARRRSIEAEYEFPFQGHTAIGPAHAMADPSNDQMTIWSNDMKSYGLRTSVAEFLGMPLDRVRVMYMDGPQLYGRTAADDAGFEAAFLAKEIGRPVRVQWMRHEETAWDTKGPAYTFKLRGGLDAQGNLVALDYNARAVDYNHLGYNEADTVLIAQLMGVRRSKPARRRCGVAVGAVRHPEPAQGGPGREPAARVGDAASHRQPARSRTVRRCTFAGESFIDELAAAAKADPVAFRMKLLTASTNDDTPVQARPLHRRGQGGGGGVRVGCPRRRRSRLGTGTILTGRGIAYCFRNQTVVAEIAEVEVNRETGHVWVKRLVCAHDCGLVINPEGLRRTIEGNMLYGMSRALHEEVRFDTEKVTSVDWNSHPTLTHADAPARSTSCCVNGDPNPNRPDLPHYGAGEAACRPTVAAVANAIFDATGVRLRRVPFRDARVLAALKAARV